MLFEDFLGASARFGIFKPPHFQTRKYLVFCLWGPCNLHVIYQKLLLQSNLLSWYHLHVCHKLAHSLPEHDVVNLWSCLSRLVRDEVAILFLEASVAKEEVVC